MELANLADRPALNVACSFDRPIVDAEGRDVAELGLFCHMTFLGPRRRVRTLLDSLPGYFARADTATVAVIVEYQRPGEPRRAAKVTHNFALYRELAYRI